MVIQAVRGFNDIIDESDIARLHDIESKLVLIAQSHGYTEVRLPFLENIDLYQRSIGATSDIVSKEMYSFTDKSDEILCLRPEGTASCIRAAIEHNALYEGSKKWYYHSPMFRRERPQKGRYRQFYQFGMEAIGINEPYVDIEHIILINDLFAELNIQKQIRLELNYLGGSDTRAKYKQALQEYYSKYSDIMGDTDKKRLEENPLRILDSKDAQLQEINATAPKMSSYYNTTEQTSLETIVNLLEDNAIKYTIQPYLVRGLDYYGGLIYEWISSELGAQATVCGGGRYDTLSTQIGADIIPATGFSIGMERLIQHIDSNASTPTKLLWINLSEQAQQSSIATCREIRTHCPQITIDNSFSSSAIKKQLKKANKRSYNYVIISGEDELKSGKYQLKNMNTQEQQNLTVSEINQYLQQEKQHANN